MGYWKNYAILVAERGYEASDKFVCAGCLKEKYFSKLIHNNGRECEFCAD